MKVCVLHKLQTKVISKPRIMSEKTLFSAATQREFRRQNPLSKGSSNCLLRLYSLVNYKYNNTRTLTFKSQLMIAFYTTVNHIRRQPTNSEKQRRNGSLKYRYNWGISNKKPSGVISGPLYRNNTGILKFKTQLMISFYDGNQWTNNQNPRFLIF